MDIVDGLPAVLHRFSGTVAGAVVERHRRMLVTLVLAYAISFGRRNLLSIYAQVEMEKVRQRVSAALNGRDLKASAAIRASAILLVNELSLSDGEEIQFVIDPTKKAKRGKKMEAAHWFHDSSTGRKVFGHQFVVAALRVRGHVIPWAVEVYAPRDFCGSAEGQKLGLRYRSLQKISAEMLGSLPEEWRRRFRIVVLFDSALFVKPVLQVLKHLGLTYVSRAQVSRAFWPEDWRGRKTNLGPYAPGVHRSEAKRLRVPKEDGTAEVFHVALRDGRMRDAGMVRVIFSRREHGGKLVHLVTNDRTMTPKQILDTYAQRWWIEVLFKQLKGLLGFGDYQTRCFTGIWNHVSVVALAHMQLSYLGLAAPEVQRRRAHREPRLPRVAALQDRLRSLVSIEKVDHLLREVRSPSLTAKLRAFFRRPQQLLLPMRT